MSYNPGYENRHNILHAVHAVFMLRSYIHIWTHAIKYKFGFNDLISLKNNSSFVNYY